MTELFCPLNSSMSGSLGGSMGGSCLQQRPDGYPAYVFHEPLHSLSQSYSHAAHQSAAVAHSQAHRGIPSGAHVPGAPTTPGAQGTAGHGAASYQPATSTATGESQFSFYLMYSLSAPR